jgi:L-alanine-DL-glutamate epimerase-like enolase superfamily enzyme
VRISGYELNRFQFARDRVIGDSQVRAVEANAVALELIDESGKRGLGFAQTLFVPLPVAAEIERIFTIEAWPSLEGQLPLSLVHRVSRPRGGNQRSATLPFHDAVQTALWDLAAKQVGLPLHEFLGSRRNRVRAYASGLDFHLTDSEFVELFGKADAEGYKAFKIKVGHPEFERDLHRLELLKKTVQRGSTIMIDANEAWGAKEAVTKIHAIKDAGYELLWVEDPILRDDFDGLRMLRSAVPFTMINSGEYLDVSGKRKLLLAGATDILNVHGAVTDVMRIGWLAAEMGVPVSLGNTFLEVGVHMACALPEVEWLEYSFQNFDHLVEMPIKPIGGWIVPPDRPGHGLTLADAARRSARP